MVRQHGIFYGCCRRRDLSLAPCLNYKLLYRIVNAKKVKLFVSAENWSNNMVEASVSSSTATQMPTKRDEAPRKILKCNFVNLLIIKKIYCQSRQQTIKKTSFEIIICTCIEHKRVERLTMRAVIIKRRQACTHRRYEENINWKLLDILWIFYALMQLW